MQDYYIVREPQPPFCMVGGGMPGPFEEFNSAERQPLPGPGFQPGQGPGFLPGPGFTPGPPQFGPGFQPGGGPGFPPGQGPGFQPGGGGPPTGRPPSFIPSLAAAQPGGPAVFAVDPGALAPCRFRFVYIWLDNRQQFWAWLVFVGRRSVAGWRWNGFRWVYFGVDLDRISSFICY